MMSESVEQVAARAVDLWRRSIRFGMLFRARVATPHGGFGALAAANNVCNARIASMARSLLAVVPRWKYPKATPGRAAVPIAVLAVTAIGAGGAAAEMIGGPPGTVQIGTTSADHPNGIVAVAIGGCASGTVAVATVAPDLVGRCGASGVIGVGLGTDAYGTQAAVSPTGSATSDNPYNGIAVSGAGPSGAQLIAVSGAGPSRSRDLALSGTSDAYSSFVAVSGAGPSRGEDVALSGTNDAYATRGGGIGLGGGNTEGYVAGSGWGRAYGTLLGVSGWEEARGYVALSGQGYATGALLGLSGTGPAGADFLAVAPLGDTVGGQAAVGMGNAWGGLLAVSAAGGATSPGAVAVAGGNAEGGLVAISATGDACGAAVLSVAPLGRAC